MVEVTIRPAQVHDVPAIQQVARESWHAAYDGVLGPEAVEKMIEQWYAEDALERSVTDEDQPFVVAVDGDELVGFANATREPESGTWHLARIYVDPEHWGEGVGTALLEWIETTLDRRGVDAYELAVLAGNDVGVAFYEARGFDRIGSKTVELVGVEATEYWYRREL